VKFALTSETSSASEIGKGIYNGKNKIGKTVLFRSTIIRENANLDKQTLQQNIDWFTIDFQTMSIYECDNNLSGRKPNHLFVFL
jgi:hypothetical protein